MYDENGSAYGMLLKNGTTEEYYYYIFNAQGDVIGIVDSAGIQVVEYTYSPWGEILSVTGTMADTIGQKNPLRYRGYYYDNETGFYYLQSRYYDPETGRFINADGAIPGVGGNVLQYNMFISRACETVSVSETISKKNSEFLVQLIMPVLHTFEAAYDVSIVYNVPLYSQGKYKLCWAFCQVMVEDFRAGVIQTNANATDRAIKIAKDFHNGTDWNRGGWPTNSRDLFADTGINSFDDLYNALIRNGPIYAYYGGVDGAHLVVITGANKTKQTIYTNNPWGIAGEQTYSRFLEGFVGMHSDWDMPFGFYIFIQ